MPADSTFAERFNFARIHQAHSGRDENDSEFALAIGASPSAITDYQQRSEAPPSHRVLAIALRCGVDPGWLEFGAKTAAPTPAGFDQWLAARREKHHEREKPPAHDFRTRSVSKQSRKRRR